MNPPVFPDTLWINERLAGGGYPTGMTDDHWDSQKSTENAVQYVRAEYADVERLQRVAKQAELAMTLLRDLRMYVSTYNSHTDACDDCGHSSWGTPTHKPTCIISRLDASLASTEAP